MASFRYKLWSFDRKKSLELFQSGQDLDGHLGFPESRGRRIGDYTGVDCSQGTGWAVWTDVRSGQQQI